MFATFSRSWELVKQSFNVLKSDRELLLFPFISMIGVVIVTLVFSVPLFFTGLVQDAANGEGGVSALSWVLLFLFYLVMYTVVIYSNVALVGAAMIRLRGGDPTLSDGFRIANSKLGQILGYAAISATVGVVLSALRNQDNLVGKIIAGIVNFAWNVVTFLVIPVLVIENVGPVEAIKRSGALLKRTWGEQIVANGGIGVVFGLLGFLLVLVVGGPMLWLGIVTDSLALIIAAVVVIIILGSLIGIFSSALNGVFTAALYNYANTGESAPGFDRALLQGAFRPK